MPGDVSPILEQPNLSTGGSILICALVMLFAAGIRRRHIALLGIGGLAVGAFYAWSAPYRRERLLSFRDPFAKMSDEDYQLSQSLIALGSGGLFGMGDGAGRQKFAYLPYPESDFIFAIVGEDFGLIGCVTVIALFVLFVLAGLRVSLACRDRFGCLLGAGITSMIGLQAFINMGVVTGMLPTTGLPLPFFSAGGTSVSVDDGGGRRAAEHFQKNGVRMIELGRINRVEEEHEIQKAQKAAAQAMVMTVVVLAVLATLLVLACSQVFRVRDLIVGNRNLSKEDVIALSGVQRATTCFPSATRS